MKRTFAKLLSSFIFIVIMTVVMVVFSLKTEEVVALYGEKGRYLLKAILVAVLFLWIFLDHYLVDLKFPPRPK